VEEKEGILSVGISQRLDEAAAALTALARARGSAPAVDVMQGSTGRGWTADSRHSRILEEAGILKTPMK
jgi:hypothetical protein